eukprot:13748312-Alexandrium_andersonii.AAC.1
MPNGPRGAPAPAHYLRLSTPQAGSGPSAQTAGRLRGGGAASGPGLEGGPARVARLASYGERTSGSRLQSTAARQAAGPRSKCTAALAGVWQ